MEYVLNPLHGLIFGFLLLPIGCIVLERLWPSIKGMPVFRRGFEGDVVWYFVQVFTQRIAAPWIVIITAVLPFYVIADIPLSKMTSGFGPVAELHLGWQVLIVYVVYDFCSYWQHRLFHTSTFWPVHAVHHSSESLDWLSATRFHPLNEIAVQFASVTPLMCMGINPIAFVILAPFTGTYAVLLHANLNWTFGPFRYVIASPIFHRWHHTSQAEGRNRNFAGGLPLWDLLFGTFYMPKGQAPERFGIDEPFPEGFTAQLMYPRRKSTGNDHMGEA